MAYQTVFNRFELKYMLTDRQKEKILSSAKPYMTPDEHGRTTVRNIYFDTDNFRLIRRSIEKPAYKEKLRIRSYSKAAPDSTVFVELKKKYKSVVYKRRIPMPEEDAMRWICERQSCAAETQIAREIDYFLDYYGCLHPAAFLSYDREAYYSNECSDLRITFDRNILCRLTDLSLCSEICGTPLIEDKTSLMEIKCRGGIPLWLTRILSEEHIYKTSFSKYGTAYMTMIFPNLKEVFYA